jgi:chromosome segregation ATPase
MRKLERSNTNRPNPDQIKAYSQGRVQQENDRLNHQHEQLWQQIEEDSVGIAKLQQEKQGLQQEKKGILQKLMDAIISRDDAIASRKDAITSRDDAIASRNSMRGRLGNMTAQRNKAHEQLKVTMDRLVEANQQVGAIQQEYDQDMEEMAKAYQEMSPEQRSSLPPKLRHLLNQVAKDYKE